MAGGRGGWWQPHQVAGPLVAPPGDARIQRPVVLPEVLGRADDHLGVRDKFVNRIKLWRYLTGNKTWDADYWLTRIENEYDNA